MGRVAVMWLAATFWCAAQANTKLPADIGVGYRYEPLVVRVGDRSTNPGLVGLAGRLN